MKCAASVLRTPHNFSRPTVITGLFIQQIVALFVLKTGAGYSFFRYIANLAEDFLTQANNGARFFFDAETISKHWFYVNTVRCICFWPFQFYQGITAFFDYLLHRNSPDALSRTSAFVSVFFFACLGPCMQLGVMQWIIKGL